MGEITTTRQTEAESRADIYQRITDRIAAAIEAGAGEWRMPWHPGADGAAPVLPVNAATSKPYRGVNVVVLWATAQAEGYPRAIWATYRQWAELGAQVRKGERASPVVFWKISDREEQEDSDEGAEDGRRSRVFARGYSVFNAAQVDGYAAPALPVLPEAERIGHAETFFAAIGADIWHGGNRACYVPNLDQMPPFEAFRDPVAYYATLGHEATHLTRYPSRCDRDLRGRFGDETYAAEELVAELGAAFLCADLALTPEPRPDHAAYVASWLKVLRSDKRAIFTAADWMHAQQNDELAIARQVRAAPLLATRLNRHVVAPSCRRVGTMPRQRVGMMSRPRSLHRRDCSLPCCHAAMAAWSYGNTKTCKRARTTACAHGGIVSRLAACHRAGTTTRVHDYMQTIAVISQKGGAGKTTLALHIAVAAELAGYSTVLIDMDPQGTAEAWSEWRKEAPPVVIPAKVGTLVRTLEKAGGLGADFAVIDTPPLAEAEARAAAKAADLVLVPCRPNAFDLHSIRTTTDLTRFAAKPAFAVFNSGPATAPRHYAETTELVTEIGMQVAPARLSERASFRHATGSGKAAQEVEPEGRAAEEIEGLWCWICEQVAMPPRRRANTPAKVTA